MRVRSERWAVVTLGSRLKQVFIASFIVMLSGCITVNDSELVELEPIGDMHKTAGIGLLPIEFSKLNESVSDVPKEDLEKGRLDTKKLLEGSGYFSSVKLVEKTGMTPYTLEVSYAIGAEEGNYFWAGLHGLTLGLLPFRIAQAKIDASYRVFNEDGTQIANYKFQDKQSIWSQTLLIFVMPFRSAEDVGREQSESTFNRFLNSVKKDSIL